MKKFAIYSRKSTESEDRQVLSISSQTDEMRKTQQSLGLNVVKVYEEARSASKLGRPVFAQMMQDILDGKIDGILCWKLDRLARNPIDGGQMIWALKEQNLVIQTPTQLYSADKENQIMLYLEFGMAQKYTDDLSKNVKRGNWKKINMGGWCGVAPIGYLNKLDDHTLIRDPDRFPLVRKLWDMILEGVPPEQARNILNDDLGFRTVVRKRSGGEPLSRSGLYRLIRNPFYCGLIERKHDGQMVKVKGIHEPVISEEEYWQAQKILGRPVPRPQTKSFPYTGLIRCGQCGAMFSGYEKIKKSGRRYVYYRCTRKNKKTICDSEQITEQDIGSQIHAVLNSITIPEGFAGWAVKWLRYVNEHETDTQLVAREALLAAYNEVQRRMEKLTDMLLQELIDEDGYKKKKLELTLERDRLKGKLGDEEQESDRWMVKIEKVFNFAKSAKTKFETNDSVLARKEIVHGLGSNYTLKAGKLALNIEDVWELFAKHSAQLHEDMKLLELLENGEPKEKTTEFLSVVSSWQGRRGSNPE